MRGGPNCGKDVVVNSSTNLEFAFNFSSTIIVERLDFGLRWSVITEVIVKELKVELILKSYVANHCTEFTLEHRGS